MHKQSSFPLRIGSQDRMRAKRIAQGMSENRLYSDLIQEGLLMREQMAYFEKLREIRVSPSEGLQLLDTTPDVPPDRGDELMARAGTRGRK